MENMPSLRSLIIGAAIAVAVGILGSYLWQQPAAVAVLRGGAATPTLESPKDEVIPASALTFKWRGSGDSTRIVVVDLSAPDKPVIDRTVGGDRYEPTPDERGKFVAGRQYHWFVEARSDNASRSSTAAQFTMR